MTHEERQKAFDAAHVLDVLSAVFAALDEKYVAAWKTSSNAVKREDWWQRQRALQDVRRELFAQVENAALKEHGKDKALNAALLAAKRGI